MGWGVRFEDLDIRLDKVRGGEDTLAVVKVEFAVFCKSFVKRCEIIKKITL